MEIKTFQPEASQAAREMFSDLEVHELVVEGFWSQTMYHGGYISYWLCRSGETWILEAVERSGELDGVTEEDIDEGRLNDDQIEALAGRSLEEAQNDTWEYVVAVGRGFDPSTPHQQIADRLYSSLEGDSFKLVSEREDDHGLLSDEAFDFDQI